MITFNYCSEIKTKNNLFYPIHLKSEQLSFITDYVITKIHDANVIIAFARKSQFKGIEFKIVCSTNNIITDIKNITREYSILINPNWNIQIIDHWRDPLYKVRCENLNNGSEELNKMIYNDILSNVTELFEVTENIIFSKDEWICIRKIKDVVLI